MGYIERRCRCRTKEDRERCTCPPAAVSFRAGYYVAGRKGAQETFDRRAEAKRWLNDQEGQLARGTHVDPRAGQTLFVDWAAEWEKTRTGKPSARQADTGRLNHHLVPEFGTLPLAAITTLAVRQWIAALANEGLAPKTVRHCHGLLHHILDAAIDSRLIASNPCAGTKLPEATREDPVFLEPAELQALVAAADEHWRPLVVLLAGTGLRWGEAVGLRARWLDLPHARLMVRWTWSDGFGWQASPKTKHSRRTVTLPPFVVDELAVPWANATGEDPVLRAPAGGMVRHSSFTRWEKRGKRVQMGPWWRAVEKAGLLEKRPTPHDLRHTHASLLIADGVPLTAIQRRLGHKSIATTSDVYGHLLPSVDEGVLGSVERALTGDTSAR